MKTIILSIIILSLLSCTPTSKANMIKGKWQITSWIITNNDIDLMEDPEAPEYTIDFMKDSVFITEKGLKISRNYSFPWSLKEDTLCVGSLGNFYINYLDNEKLILLINTVPIFEKEKEEREEKITLLKRRI